MQLDEVRRKTRRAAASVGAVIGATIAVGVLGPQALAQQTTPAANAAQIARNPTEIPPEWTALAAAHPCMANPWGAGCPNPPKEVSFPSPDQLRATLETIQMGPAAAAGGLPPTSVRNPGGAELITRPQPLPGDAAASTSTSSRTARAAQNVGACYLDVSYPEIVVYGSTRYARGISDVSCPIGYIEGNVTDDLYRSGSLLATDYDESFSEPIYVIATALYHCNHQNAYPYTNVGLGYVELYNGTAAANSDTHNQNHTCPPV